MKEDILEAFEDGRRPVRPEDLERAVGAIRPLAQVKPNEIEDLRRWARDALALRQPRRAARRTRVALTRALSRTALHQRRDYPMPCGSRALLTAYVAYQPSHLPSVTCRWPRYQAGYRVETPPRHRDV